MGSPKLRQDRVREAAVGCSTDEGAATGVVYGVSGSTSSATNGAAGVTGYAGAATGQVNGVAGTSLSTGGTGVSASASPATGSTNGVYGQSASSTGNRVVGNAIATSGTTFGVRRLLRECGIGIQANNTSTGEVVALGGPSPYLSNAFINKTGIFTVDNSGNGFFCGNLHITGKLTKGGGSFKIDHPSIYPTRLSSRLT